MATEPKKLTEQDWAIIKSALDTAEANYRRAANAAKNEDVKLAYKNVLQAYQMVKAKIA